MKRTLSLALGVLGLLAFSALPVAAHGAAARTDVRKAGPYALQINQYADPAHVGQSMDVTVSAVPGGPSLADTSLTVAGQPAPGTDATQTRALPLREEVPQEPGSYAASISFPVAGAWQLVVAVDGAAGTATATVPVQVAAPTAIPFWLGWLIGLSPLLGVAWFAWWNHAYLRGLQAPLRG